MVGFLIQFMDEKIGPNFKLRPKTKQKKKLVKWLISKPACNPKLSPE
jgi:hypothetical protein